MKKITLILAIMLTTIGFAQTTIDLSGMNGEVTLGQNCSNSQEQQVYITTGDVNLNGGELILRNVYLIVNGNVNGYGDITGCGNSKICRTGSVQNIPLITNVEMTTGCGTLDTPDNEFDFNKYGLSYKVYDVTGKLLVQGITNERTYSELPSGRILFMIVEGKHFKKIIKQ